MSVFRSRRTSLSIIQIRLAPSIWPGNLSPLCPFDGLKITTSRKSQTPQAVEALGTGGGFFLGTIGGAAALIAKEHIVSSEVMDFAGLGLEAVRKIIVRDLPAFLINNDKGENLSPSR